MVLVLVLVLVWIVVLVLVWIVVWMNLWVVSVSLRVVVVVVVSKRYRLRGLIMELYIPPSSNGRDWRILESLFVSLV